MPTVTCTSSDTSVLASKTLCKAFFVSESEGVLQLPEKQLGNFLDSVVRYAAQRDFTGKAGTRIVTLVEHEGQTISIALIGLGPKDAKQGISVETYRRAVGNLIRLAEHMKWPSIALPLPVDLVTQATTTYLAQQTALIASMAAYKYNEYITKKTKFDDAVIALTVCVEKDDVKKVQAALDEGMLIARGVNNTRLWIDTPPSKLTPPELALKAKEVADRHKLPITIFDEAQIKQMGMGGLAGVSAGSDQDCRFVVMEYLYDKKAPTLAFVGKGITFDSGGLSIKPATAMETMKEDMSGAAAVISAMDIIATLKPKVNVIGITPLSENLPSGRATKPGDILTFYDGSTAEVRNTDAEGRLVLADGLAYAVKHYKPDVIIDIATLTGACAYSLGPFFTGLMGTDETVLQRVEKAAHITGDRVWRLPFDNDYKQAIKSNVADIANTGSRKIKAGTITAGFFLNHFVKDTPWAHLDIAGTAFDVPSISYYRSESATGAGVRLLVELARNWPSSY